ncbi:MAG: hypothetical protein MUO67_08400 [Anaerolineales bacterium]|nr:hypothetical protein [Anaerolineales bacterium]
MNHTIVLKKAWQVLWRYKALWLFGVLLALTSVSAWMLILNNNAEDDLAYQGFQINLIPSQGIEINLPSVVSGNIPVDPTGERILIPGTKISLPNFTRHVNFEFGGVVTITRQDGIEFEFKGYQDWMQLPAQTRNTLITIFLVLAVLVVSLWFISRVVYHVSDTALIRMVDDYDETGTRRNVWRGLGLGFSRPAWRFFLMDLLIDLPVGFVFLVLFTLVSVPSFLWLTGSPIFSTFGMLLTISLGLLVVVLAIFTSILLRLLKHFFHRACALEDLGVIASLRRGYAVVRQHVKDVGLMWLVVAAIYIVWPMMILPFVMLLIGFGLAIGGSIALLAGGLFTLVSGSAVLPWIIAALTGFITFILTLAVPLVFLGGLRAVYVSSAWTLTYRELRPLTTVLPQAVAVPPAPEAKTLEVDASAAV